VKIKEAERHCLVKFFSDEGMPGVQIVARHIQHYGEGALSRTQVYYWINKIKRGRTDLNTIASPGTEPDESYAVVIVDKFNTDSNLSARKHAQSLGIAGSTVC
jgi:hypothetical protein